MAFRPRQRECIEAPRCIGHLATFHLCQSGAFTGSQAAAMARPFLGLRKHCIGIIREMGQAARQLRRWGLRHGDRAEAKGADNPC
ncbi:hypothetical protein AA101099_2051 [Neoasaia chiangmaiensis NBRC 101099]|nr:hypothetical protein AA101099_2051 [Neoasaia chiangmaiensis NBRC 101099]GEN13963.1 hypothetical protein NCH01_03940 [Neoasaia chiangmaiensis]